MRRISSTAALAVIVAASLAGCSGSEGATQSTTSSPAEQRFDLSKLSQVEADMPEGFVPFPTEVSKLQPNYVAGVGSVVAGAKRFDVEPANCKSLLKPVDGIAGSDSAGFRADGEQRRSIALSADMPVTVRVELPVSGCDRMSYTVAGEDHPSSGTAERIEAPTINGAETYALKVKVDGYADPEYYYGAIIDDRLYVKVHARLAPDYPAQPVLPDLLVKAVTAIRS